MKRLFLLLVVLSLTACSAQKGDVGDGDVDNSGPAGDTDTDEDPGGMELVFQLDTDSAGAGDPIGFELSWQYSSGEQDPVEMFTITSDLEEDVDVSDVSLVLTREGEHSLQVAAVDDSGAEQSASTMVTISAGDLATLALTLSADAVTAGESVEGLLSAEDAYGNPLPIDAAEWTIPEGVEQEDSMFTSTTVGEYTVTAALETLTADASWTVQPGPVASIDLVLSSTDLDPGDDVTYSIATMDEYGNAADVETELTVSDGVIVDDDVITFPIEGIFVCTASIPDTDLSDTETVIIDDSSPDLIITTPDRADSTTEDTVAVEGTAVDAFTGLASLTISGEDVYVDDDGTFAHDLTLNYGINIIETVAVDGDVDSNEVRDVRSVLQVGEWINPARYRADALLVRINEGTGGLDQLGAIAPTIMDSVDLESLLGGELYSASGGSWIFSYDISMTATDVSYGDASVAVDAVADGTLELRLTVSDLRMDFVVEGDAPFVSLPSEGAVTIDAMHVDISVRPTIVDGALSFEDVTVSVPEPDGLTVSIDSGLSSLASFIGIDIDTLVVAEMRSAVEGAVAGETDGLFDGILGDFAIEETFEVSGMTYSLLAEPDSIDVDDDGMIIAFDTRVIPEEVLSAGAIDGIEDIPGFDWSAPELMADGSGVQLAMSTDLLNQLMFAMWQGGLLDQELTAEDLGVDPAVLALVFSDVEDLTMVTTPLLPPVFTPREESDTDDVGRSYGNEERRYSTAQHPEERPREVRVPIRPACG